MSLRNFSSTAAATTLSAGVTSGATSIAVASTVGFPAAPFILAVDAGAAAQELVLVTTVAGTTLTVTRGYDSTVAAAHIAGAVVQHSHAGLDFREANTHVNAAVGVHGLAGSVVGSTDAQSLTNKTLALGSNTVSGTRAQFNAALTDDDFATLAGVEVLTGKTLTAPTVNGVVAGTTFGAWTSYGTPTTIVTASTTNPTLGTASSAVAYYNQVGKLIRFRIEVICGTAGTAAGSGTYQFLLPVAPRAGTLAPVGAGVVQEGAGGAVTVSSLLWSAGVVGHFYLHSFTAASGGLGNVAANRRYLISGTYEAA